MPAPNPCVSTAVRKTSPSAWHLALVGRALNNPLMRATAVLGLLLSACTSCGPSGPAVPFGLEGPAQPADPPEESNDPAVPPTRAQTFATGVTELNLDGLTLHSDSPIHALAQRDVDRDGDDDVIAVVQAPPRVLFWRRGQTGFSAPRDIGVSDPHGGAACEVLQAQVRPLGEAWWVVRAELLCWGEPPTLRIDRWVLDTDRTPRVLERIGTLGPGAGEDGADVPAIGVELGTDDRDGDGRPDLTVAIQVGSGPARSDVTLSWFDRPSGLARDPSEPEATLSERSRDALRRLRSDPAEARLRSMRVLSLHAALCRESGRALLLVGGRAGVRCGQSGGAGRAATTIVRAHAAEGALLPALDAFERMNAPGLLITDERRDYARRALAQAPGQGGGRLAEGPEISAGPDDPAQLSAIGFLDEQHLLLRTTPPRVLDLETREIAPAENGSRRLRDPSGRFEVRSIERTCEGHVLQISDNGVPSTDAMIERVPPPDGAHCPLTGAESEDAGGWRALGWAPQGILLTRGQDLRIVPLDVDGRPVGEPRTLAPGAPTPAPLPPGFISRAGQQLVELRGPAVFVRPLSGGDEPELLWPEGWGELEGTPSHAAVSPSGRRVAVVRDGRVFLLEREADHP